VLDGADPALTGPGGTGGQRLVGTLLGAGAGFGAGVEVGAFEADRLAGLAAAADLEVAADLRDGAPVGECAGLRWARHELAGPGWLVVALGTDPVALSRVLSGGAPRATVAAGSDGATVPATAPG
jgi:hypothetical protein